MRAIRRAATGLATTALTTATLVAGALVVAPSPAHADHARVPDGRTATPYVVRPGDTATGLAVRFRAWTAELIAHNHLGPDARLRVGQRIVIPVVTARARSTAQRRQAAPRKRAASHERRTRPRVRRHADPSRERVRAVIARTARRHGVDPHLALAVSWQEAGWQMHHVSSANAIGAMQVLPSTGEWMEQYAGRALRLWRLHDNATAGVLLLKVLGDHTTRPRHRIGAYYQGLGAVRSHGLYGETKRYVANVVAIKSLLERGLPPA